MSDKALPDKRSVNVCVKRRESGFAGMATLFERIFYIGRDGEFGTMKCMPNENLCYRRCGKCMR